jgi:AraC-like DNA-binding protein
MHRSYKDPCDYVQSIRLVHDADLAVSERGTFDAALTVIDLGRVWLQRGSENLARTVHVSVEDSRRSLLFLADRHVRPILQSGVEFGPDQVVSLAPASNHFQRTFGPVQWAAMSLPPGCLEEAGRALVDRDLADPGTLWSKSSAGYLTRLRQLHENVSRLARFDDGALDHPEVMRSLEQSFIGAMVGCLADGTDQGGGNGWHRHQQVMRQFKEWLETNIDRPVYLQEICIGLNISAPTLRRCCEEHLGMSPMKYLWLRRMNLVRDHLQRRHGPTSVTATAMQYGFWHLGRFASEYRTLFGETPSTTLARPPIG